MGLLPLTRLRDAETASSADSFVKRVAATGRLGYLGTESSVKHAVMALGQEAVASPAHSPSSSRTRKVLTAKSWTRGARAEGDREGDHQGQGRWTPGAERQLFVCLEFADPIFGSQRLLEGDHSRPATLASGPPTTSSPPDGRHPGCRAAASSTGTRPRRDPIGRCRGITILVQLPLRRNDRESAVPGSALVRLRLLSQRLEPPVDLTRVRVSTVRRRTPAWGGGRQSIPARFSASSVSSGPVPY